MNRNIVYIRVLLVVLSIAILVAFINRSPHRALHDTWLPSSFNPVGAGNMAFFETLQNLNWPVSRWQEPLSRLSDYGTGNALVITRSPVGWRVGFSEQENDLLKHWVAQGNTLVLLGSFQEWEDTRALLREFGFALPENLNQSVSAFFHPFEPESREPLEIPAAPDAPLAGTLVLPRNTAALPVAGPPGTRLLWQSQGQPYAMEAPIGAGHLVWVASAQLLANSFASRGDNLAISLRLLAPGGQVPRRLFLEESHHGFSAIYALAELLGAPGVRFGAMLAILGLLTFFGSSLVRFGPVVPLRRKPGRSTIEFVDSIADLYQRADLRNEMIAYLFTQTHERILHRLHLPPTASHELIASRLQQAHPHLPKWKKLAQRFDSRDYVNGLPPSGWLLVARELIEIKSAMA